MSERKSRLDRLKREHISCCYCPGPVETAEHCPAKVLFTGKHRPEGWEFPSCKKCNKGTSQSDQIMAFFVFSQILAPTPDEEAHLNKVMQALGNNHKEIVGELVARPRLHAGYPLVQMPDSMVLHIETVCDKIAMSAYYKEHGRRLPVETEISHTYLTNHYLIEHGYPQDAMQKLPAFKALMQGKKWTSFDQFRYRYASLTDADVMFAEFHFMNRMAIITALFIDGEAHRAAKALGLDTHRSALPRA